MVDIAALAGVAASTVSRALAGSPLVAKKKREEIIRLARERGYLVNTAARSLRMQRKETISVVVPLGHEAGQPLSDPFFVEILGHLVDEITQRGYGVFLQKVLPPMNDWLNGIIGSRRSDGIIVVGQSTEHFVLEAAAGSYRPLVVWGGHTADQSYCTVGTDNVAGALAAVEHLIRLGRRRIAFMGECRSPEIQLRYEGYRLALRRGGTLEAQQIVPTHLTPDAAYEAMRSFISRGAKFDAVFAATDVIAISAIRALIGAGLRVPQDVAVVGYDDIMMAAHTNPALTTVRQDVKRGAANLVNLLFRRLAGEDAPSATMPAELIVRESSGEPCR
ncbi:MAG: substrate-binding domain-containing protein [Pseudomonadota bacterium]|nr:substrate-binding domain-containing protein [Pseudomonadota bacterium]